MQHNTSQPTSKALSWVEHISCAADIAQAAHDHGYQSDYEAGRASVHDSPPDSTIGPRPAASSGELR